MLILILHRRRNRDAEEFPHHLLRLLQSALLDDLDGQVARFLHQLEVADYVAEAEAQGAGLARAQELAGTAELEIEIGELETVQRLRELREPLLLLVRHQHAIRLARPAADAAAELVELRETETVGVDDQHQRG